MISRRDFVKTGIVAGIGGTLYGEIMSIENEAVSADLIITNAKIATQNQQREFAEALAIKDGKLVFVGREREAMRFKGEKTQIINAQKKCVIPGLNDSHIHPIRGGLNYNMELRWDGVDSLADALGMLRAQAQITPAPQWVRVIGGWTEFQFKEKRMPTLAEINRAAPDTPVFILHLYDRAFLNGAALRAVGYTKDTPNPPGGEIERDKQGNPTGLLIARPNANILYATLAKGPKLSYDDQVNSTRQFMRELNRFGVTSVIDAGGGFQNYPDDYKVIEQLHKENLLTTRIAYNLFTQKPKEELQDFERWTKLVKPRQGDDFYRHNGAGEMLVFSAADFEDFLEPRPALPETMEAELFRVVKLLAENKWAFRLHATYDESITRALDVYEKVHREVPIDKLGWFIDHAETISEKNIERIKTLGGGIAIQHRMAYQGEYFADRYGEAKLKHSPPIQKMLGAGVPVGAGTDATRVASYNPFVSLYWIVSGKSVGGMQMYDESNRLDRMEALRLWTVGSSWFSNDSGKKGSIEVGQLADLAVLSKDFFTVAEEEIKSLESILTIVGGKIVYAKDDYKEFAPPALPISPSWSPVKNFGGYHNPVAALAELHAHSHDHAACGGHGILSNLRGKLAQKFDPFGDIGGACACAF
jgi:predicted amidohydrolase YtcJ